MAKRYGKLPSELIPRRMLPQRERLAFDYNVCLAGLIAEKEAHDEAMGKSKGVTKTKAGAKAALRRADALLLEMEREANNGGVTWQWADDG